MRQMKRTLWAGLAVLFLVPAGCSSRYTPVPVSGIVTLDGQPLDKASVTFYLVGGGKEGRPASGGTDSTGTFHLSTMGNQDGAIPGEYKVVIAKWVPGLPNLKIPNFPDTPEGKAQRDEFIYRAYGDRPREKNVLPAKYSDLEKTPLSCTVTGKVSDLKFELASK
jgi:hypothetical protein